jgi:HPt (histidine-containing phosphotransfer) domain-containing protein
MTTVVHALKSALANIGADGLSRKAALLENSLKKEDGPAISDQLHPFRDELVDLTRSIKIVATAERAKEAGAGVHPDIREILPRLREALEAMDIDAVDDALARLQAYPLDEPTRRTVTEIADSILTADYRKAADAVSEMIGRDA